MISRCIFNKCCALDNHIHFDGHHCWDYANYFLESTIPKSFLSLWRCCLGDRRSPAAQSTQSTSAHTCWVTPNNLCKDLCPCDISMRLCHSRACWWCLQTRGGQLHRTPTWMNLMRRISKWSLTPWRSSPMNTSGEALCVVCTLGKFLLIFSDP